MGVCGCSHTRNMFFPGTMGGGGTCFVLLQFSCNGQNPQRIMYSATEKLWFVNVALIQYCIW